jgi:hypothetical protein
MPNSGETVNGLQATMLSHLHRVDLTTPVQQLHEALTTLLEVPTFARQSETNFTRQTSATLALLRARTRQLADVVEKLEAVMHTSASGACAEPLPGQSVFLSDRAAAQSLARSR